MTRKRRLRQKAMRALGRQIRDSGSRLPHVLIPVTMVISSLAAGHVSGSTFALSQDAVAAPRIEFQTLTTSQVLRFSSGRVQLVTEAGPDRVGSEVVRTFHIMNISDRHVSLSVELTGIPWARAALSRNVLGPGETADIVVSGTPDEPGEYRGYLVVYGMGGFLELGMEFTVVVMPAPQSLDPCRPDDRPNPRVAVGDEPDPAAEEPEEAGSSTFIGLHPDLLGLPSGDSPGADADPEIALPGADPEPAETEAAPEPADEVAGPEPAEEEGGDEAAAPEDGEDAGQGASPVRKDPCADGAVAEPPSPVQECVPDVEAALAGETAGVSEESGDCAEAGSPPGGDGAGSGGGETEGRTEEGQEEAPDAGDGEPGGQEESVAQDEAEGEFAEGETGGGESDGEASGGDAQGGASAGEGSGDGSEGDTDAGGSSEGDGDTEESSGGEDGGSGSSDDRGGEGESAGDGSGGSDASGSTGRGESGGGAADGAGGSAGDGAAAGPADPPAGTGEADDADAGGQTT